MGENLALVAAMVLIVVAILREWPVRRALTAPRPQGAVDAVNVLIAVRSGDPLLPGLLAESVATLAPATVLLLVDDDDPAGQSAARAAASGHDHVEVIECGPPPPGRNPKVHKLMLAEHRAGPLIALLDDDTVLPPGGLAHLVGVIESGADLVTGIPVYREQGGLWSRLVAAFVNGSALVTYLPMARFGPPVTINGMVVLTRRAALDQIGGFAAVAEATCDDYALARAYRAHGLAIVQTAQIAELATTVPGPGAYARLMRRWMLFATQVVRHDLSVRLVSVVVLPAVLPLATLALALAARSGLATAIVAVALWISALGLRVLRRQAGAGPETSGLIGVLLGPVAALVSPVFALAAALGPQTVVWRGRRVRVGIGS